MFVQCMYVCMLLLQRESLLVNRLVYVDDVTMYISISIYISFYVIYIRIQLLFYLIMKATALTSAALNARRASITQLAMVPVGESLV